VILHAVAALYENRRMSTTAIRSLLLALAMLVAITQLNACAESPVTGQPELALITEADELRLGRDGDVEIRKQYGVYPNTVLQAYVQQVGERMAARSHRPQLAYQFTVLDSAEVNAFALPGGYVYITRGLLAHLNSEGELAAVLGHEIGHVTARHAVRRYSAATAATLGVAVGSIFVPELGSRVAQTLVGVIGSALLSGYGREQELEADHLGAEYLARAGYEPRAMLDVLGLLKNQELYELDVAAREHRSPRVYHGVFASHPSSDQRLQEVVATVNRQTPLPLPPVTAIDRTGFLKKLDRLAYGDSELQGIRRGNTFYHRPLGFAIQFPDDWRLSNTTERLVAHPADNNAIIDVQVAPRGKSRNPKEYTVLQMHLTDLQDMQTFDVAGSPAFSAATPAQTPFGCRQLRVAVVFRNRQAFRFLGAIRTDEQAFESLFLQTVRSLHSLRPDEQELARGRRIALVQARRGDTYAKLARRFPVPGDGENLLRLLNNQYPGGEPGRGDLIKVIR